MSLTKSVGLLAVVVYLLQVEDGRRDALDSVHCMFWVGQLATLHHHVFVKVHLPLHCRVVRLPTGAQVNGGKGRMLISQRSDPPSPAGGGSAADAPSPRHPCLSEKIHIKMEVKSNFHHSELTL